MYIKAIYRNTVSMGTIYIENFCLWVKTAVWDAPRRIYLDIDLERHRIEMEQGRLSRVGSSDSITE
jgi:hypothetical protein